MDLYELEGNTEKPGLEKLWGRAGMGRWDVDDIPQVEDMAQELKTYYIHHVQGP